MGMRPRRAAAHNEDMAVIDRLMLVAAMVGLAAGAQRGMSAESAEEWIPLFDGRSLAGWKEPPFLTPGKVEVKDGTIVLGRGRMTGITWTGEFPRSGYEIRFEAARLEGKDYFAGITFPVKEEHCSWVSGGWDGTVVGLSNVDGYDASENETSAAREFESGRWYQFRLAVTEKRIRAWIDGEVVVDLETAARKFGLPFGESDLSAPLGFSSYGTKAGLRKVEYRRLSGEPAR